MMRRKIKVSKKKKGKLGTAEDASNRNEVRDFLQEAEKAIQQANHKSRSFPPIQQTPEAEAPPRESAESPIPMETGVANSTDDDSTVAASNPKHVEDKIENTDDAAPSDPTDALAISRDAPVAIDDRIKALAKAADEFYENELYDEAMLHYTEVLLLAKPLCEERLTFSSDGDDDKQLLYQKLIANSHAQIGFIKFSLGAPKAAMDDYCVAVTHYQLYRDWLALQLKELKSPDEAKRLRSLIDEADHIIGALLTKMGQIQMQSENMNWMFAMELNETALRVFKNLRMRIIANAGGGVLTREEVEDQIIILLDTISELHSIQGDDDAARRAQSEASRLQKRGEERGGTGGNSTSFSSTKGLPSLGKTFGKAKNPSSYNASRNGATPNSFVPLLNTTTTLLTPVVKASKNLMCCDNDIIKTTDNRSPEDTDRNGKEQNDSKGRLVV